MEFIGSLKQLRSSWRFDLVAGFTVAIVALPLALGFGITSGAGAASGLATAIVAGLLAAIFGGSNFQVSGPTGAMTVILVPIIATYSISALLPLGIMAGVLVILLGVLRLGRFVESIPWSVMEGFTLGIALIIALQQVPLVFGVSSGKGESTLAIASDTVLKAIAGGVDWETVGIVLFTLTIKILWSKFKNRFGPLSQLPASAIAVVLATALVAMTRIEVATVGAIPAGDVFQIQGLDRSIDLSILVLPAVSIALLAAIEALLAARVADSMAKSTDSGVSKKHNPNQELIGQGLASIGSAIVGGMPSTGAIARTAVNVHSGAKTRYAAVFHSVALLVMVFALAPVVSQIPLAALAGVLLGTSWRIANPRTIREALQTTWQSRLVYLSTAVFVLVVDLIVGLLAGIVLHLLLKLVGKSR